ncbi:hypothetical protein [Citrobacter portucalensis]|uniref:hypothetical protein n=1 Tax=Citrobacter portucalensis TaxID=1639133 RepID=UPI0039794DAF
MGTTINDGGLEEVRKGKSTGTIINYNGRQTVNGGTADKAIINGGTQRIQTGASATGSTVNTGGVLIFLHSSSYQFLSYNSIFNEVALQQRQHVTLRIPLPYLLLNSCYDF